MVAGLQQSQAAVSVRSAGDRGTGAAAAGDRGKRCGRQSYGVLHCTEVEAAPGQEQEQARPAVFKAAVAARAQAHRSQVEVELRQKAAVQEQMRGQARSAAPKAALVAEPRRVRKWSLALDS